MQKKLKTALINTQLLHWYHRQIKPKNHVAIEIIWKNVKILITKRWPHKFLEGMWKFPGGKVENNETSKECLAREMVAELGIIVKIHSFIKVIKRSYSHCYITMDTYHCSIISGEPVAIQCAEYILISPTELDDLPFPSASHKLFDTVKHYEKNIAI